MKRMLFLALLLIPAAVAVVPQMTATTVAVSGETYLECGDSETYTVTITGTRDAEGNFNVPWKAYKKKFHDDDSTGIQIASGNAALAKDASKAGQTATATATFVWKCDCDWSEHKWGRLYAVEQLSSTDKKRSNDQKVLCYHDTSVFGEPHFQTWSGRWYDYMGQCDLTLLHAPFFEEGMPLTINARTKIRDNYSFIESAVAQIGTETLEVSSYGDYFLNGVANATLPQKLSGFSVAHTQQTERIHVFEITLSEDGEQKLILSSNKDMVAFSVHRADPNRFEGSLGMLGDYETGRFMARDGKTVIKDINEFAREWQVRDDEPILFQSVQLPQYPQKCLLPTVSKTTRRLGESLARKKAEEACSGWPAETREMCIYDVMATGDVEIANVLV